MPVPRFIVKVFDPTLDVLYTDIVPHDMVEEFCKKTMGFVDILLSPNYYTPMDFL